jgi:tetratricopeptide (TPR) repeat protein
VILRRVLSSTLLLGLLGVPLSASAERPLPDWKEWEADRSIRAGEFALLSNEVEAAWRAGLRAVELDEAEPKGWSLLMRSQARAGDWHATEKSGLVWSELEPKSPIPKLFVARAQVELGRTSEAELRYQGVSETLPGDPRGPLGLALCAFLQQNWTGAQKQLLEARRRDPDLELATLPLQEAWKRLSDSEEFIAVLETVLQAKTPAP